MKKSYPDLAALVLRIAFGGMMIPHGIQKLSKLTNDLPGIHFIDPLGLGDDVTYYLALFIEIIVSAALILGFYTRVCAVLLGFTMLVAAFIVHGGDPWAKKEMAMLFFSGYASIFLLGGGAYAIKK